MKGKGETAFPFFLFITKYLPEPHFSIAGLKVISLTILNVPALVRPAGGIPNLLSHMAANDAAVSYLLKQKMRGNSRILI